MKLGLPVQPRDAKPFDFVGVGECSLDVVCLAPRFPVPDEKQRAERLATLPGGQAATAAVACARLGWRSRYVGAMGDDAAAAAVRDVLREERVDIQAVTRAGVSTRSALILVDVSTGSRTVFESRDTRLDIAEDEIALEVFASGRVMLIDGSDPGLARRAARVARASGTKTLIDVDWVSDQTLDLLNCVDVVVVPAGFVREATGLQQVDAGLARLGKTLPAAAVIATAGPDGAFAWCRGAALRVPASPVKVVDTTGAGDAFRAGFAAAWLASGTSDPDLEDLLRFAGRVAAESCRGLGAQGGLPRLAELDPFGPDTV